MHISLQRGQQILRKQNRFPDMYKGKNVGTYYKHKAICMSDSN